jgi:transketolase
MACENMTTNERYRVENFKPTTAKRVPFEELNFNIYKPSANMVTFSTTEGKIPVWINTFKQRYEIGINNNNAKYSCTWEEQDDPHDSSKCEKIILKITARESQETLLTITIMVNTGRIQIQGRHIAHVKKWGNDEFPTLLKIINSKETTETTTIHPDAFLDRITNCKKSIKPESQGNPPEDIPDKQESNHQSPETSLIKSRLASLEADFINYKQNTNTIINELATTIKSKDKEVER